MRPPLNIIVKSFEGPRLTPLLKAAFRDRNIGTCFSITNEKKYMPDFKAERHIWIPAAPLRAGQYPDMDWKTITPIDEDLLEKMRGCEAVFLLMIERYAKHSDMSYTERKRQYQQHLRYWNHILETENIGLYLLNHGPHQGYDFVIYHLCKLKGIPTWHLERCYSVEGVFLAEDLEKSSTELLPRFEALKREYADPAKPVPLSPGYEEFFVSQTTQTETPWFARKREKHLTRQSFIAKWGERAIDLLRRKPWQFFASVFSPTTWHRKLAQHRAAQFYDRHAQDPDLSGPYIYVPLNLQPEEAVLPRGGAFANQELIVHMLAAHVPEGVRLYVKEHPGQGEQYRSETFYRSMQQIPVVSFVPRTFNSFALMHSAKAIGMVAGTAGFEAPFRGKPVLMFGHRFSQYAPGTYQIRTNEDCKKAMESIFVKGETPSLRDLRIFLKAIDELTVPYEGGPERPGQAPRLERARVMGEMIREKLEPLFS